MVNKYNAKRTYSELCQRWFASKLEAKRGEQLRLMEMAGEIGILKYQIPFVLSKNPKITVTIDFFYVKPLEGGIYEDAKGVLTRDSRTKYAWLEQKLGIKVKLVNKEAL